MKSLFTEHILHLDLEEHTLRFWFNREVGTEVISKFKKDNYYINSVDEIVKVSEDTFEGCLTALEIMSIYTRTGKVLYYEW